VFADVGKALHDIPSLPIFFEALRDILFGLVFLFIANWVHRDISTGNIIVVTDNEGQVHGKLSDLEYAKEFGSTTISPDPKTGTPFFMAFELLSGWSIHREWPEPSGKAGQNKGEGLHRFLTAFKTPRPPVLKEPNHAAPAQHRNAIIYNFQYDLESVWWIILWTLLARIAHAPGQEYAFRIYVNKLENTPERQCIVLIRGHLLSKLRAALHDDLSGFAKIMDEFSTELWSTYVDRERKNQVKEPSSYVAIYTTVMTLLVDCMDLLIAGERIPALVSLHPQEVVEPAKPASTDGAGASKRSRSDDDRDANTTSDTKRPRLAGRRLFCGP